MILKLDGIEQFYFVTDVHGCYDVLMDRLEEVGFDWAKDLLLIGGDNCDRGPKSLDVLKLLQYDNVKSIIGNHEQMIYDYIEYGFGAGLDRNGGSWIRQCSDNEKELIGLLISTLPQAIEVNGRVGIVHACVPGNDWNSMEACNSFSMQDSGEHIWSRDKISNNDTTIIDNIELVLVGHTPVSKPMQLGNVFYCDTGAVYSGGHLSIIRVTMGDEILVEVL